ncbi:hypothetical protein ACOMHN_008165 [Nucella lapillus]
MCKPCDSGVVRGVLMLQRPTFTGEVTGSRADPMSDSMQYQEVMRRLICRYIHQTKKQLRQDGVNEDDLLEIKQDISSLRYELREDRKREAIRTSRHIDTLRHDIHHTFFHLTPPCERPPGPYPPSYPYPPGSGPGDAGSPPSSSPGLLSRWEVQQLRKELVNELREEIRAVARQAMATCLYSNTNGVAARDRDREPVPQLPSELYHTRLYTQL